MAKTTRINDFPYTKQACEIYNCPNYADYSIHRADFQGGNRLNLCEECVLAMVTNLPEGILESIRNDELQSDNQPTNQPTNQSTNDTTEEQTGLLMKSQPTETARVSDNPRNLSQAQMQVRNQSQSQQASTVTPKDEKPIPETKKEVDDMSMPLDDHKPLEHQEKQRMTNEGGLPNQQPLPEEQKPSESVSKEEHKEKVVEVLEKQTVDELKDRAKELDIPKYYDMRKDELTHAIAEKEIENGEDS